MSHDPGDYVFPGRRTADLDDEVDHALRQADSCHESPASCQSQTPFWTRYRILIRCWKEARKIS